MPGLVSDSELRDHVAAYLGLAGGPDALAAQYLTVIPSANQEAHGKLLAFFLGRGLTAGQFATWNLGRVYQQRLGVYYTLLRASGANAYSPEWPDRLAAIWDELAGLTLVDGGGAEIEPAEVTEVSFGRNKSSSPFLESDGVTWKAT